MYFLSSKIRELITKFIQRRPSISAGYRISAGLNYGTLEGRQLLAGIVFLEDVGEVLIGGTVGNDSALVVESGDQLTVSFTGFETREFSLSEVQQLRFVGLAGDDRFENQSSVPSFAFGHNGNDVLVGGSGADRLVGNGGEDQIFGNDGDDTIVAGIGDDEVFAGAGNDRVIGVRGTNQIDGGEGDDVIFGGTEVDVITDPSGSNRIAGAAGDDTISGGSGVDTIYGGPGADRIFGNDGDDFIYGQADDDTLVGNAGADVLNGNDGDDIISSQFGDDWVVGGLGTDQSNYSGSSDEYLIEEISSDRYRVNDLRGPQFGGVDNVFGTELLNFASGSGSPASFLSPTFGNSTQRVIVQPIIAANSDGSNQAEFFGSASQETDIKNRIDEIFAQANIDIEFLPAREVNNTFINIGNGTGERSDDDLDTIVRQGDRSGLGSSDSRVIDIYFVERVPGFSTVGEFVANGLAFVGQSGIAIQIGDNLVNSASGRETAASVAAHEIGHNLGLSHIQDRNNLLDGGGGSGDNLNASQISTALNSRLSQPVGQATSSSLTTPSDQTSVAATSGEFETAGLSATVADDGTVSFEEFGHDHSDDDSGHDHFHSHDDGCQCPACSGLL